MYLSTLRSYVKAIGGELELVVKLPERPALRLLRLSDALHKPHIASTSQTKRRKRSA